MSDERQDLARASGTIDVGGDLTVRRMGFGAMRITGPGIWGDPPDREVAKAVLRRVVELGVNFIDTADSYGPAVSEELIAEALHPYPDDLVIATKGGLERTGPDEWPSAAHPDRLKRVCEESLRRLKVDTIDLYQHHRPDPAVPYAESIGALVELKERGKIRHVGVSNVDEEHLRVAQSLTPVVSVQNRYNVADRRSETMVDLCEQESITFIPYSPVKDLDGNPVVEEIATRHAVQPMQIVLAWLLARSPAMLPIPGTGSVAHLEENVAAATIRLDDDEVAAISTGAV
jgi:pyridoxine 4-dehydrogenase